MKGKKEKKEDYGREEVEASKGVNRARTKKVIPMVVFLLSEPGA